MGGQQSQELKYSVPAPQQISSIEGETLIYKNPHFPNQFLTELVIEDTICKTLQDMFLKICKTYPKKKFLGTYRKNAYEYKTYQEVLDIAKKLGSGIKKLNIAPQVCNYKDYKLKMTGIYAKNREEWIILDIANILYNNVNVPLYDSLGPQSISYVVNHSGMRNCFCDKNGIKTLLSTENLGKLEFIICLDELEIDEKQELTQKAEAKQLKLYTWAEIIQIGEENIAEFEKVEHDDVFTFSYTSGTTSNPKGALISHKNLICVVAGSNYTSAQLFYDDVYLSYLPLPHVFERLITYTLISAGATICFYRGDIKQIKKDLQLVKPTLFAGVPRVFNLFYNVMQDGIAELSGYLKQIAQLAINTKITNLRQKNEFTHAFWDKIIFSKMRNALGGKIRVLVTGSAPISSSVMEFMKIAIGCPFLEGYGQTEAVGASAITSSEDSQIGHVGGIMPGLEYKLIDIPEMSYTSKDKDDEGKPIQRGELLVRGPQVFLGYYKDDEKTKETVDRDGWLHTGDVGQLLPNGAIKIIDRKKNIFKLAQGEYIAPEKN